MKGNADYSYLKENEMGARNVARGAGTVAKPRGLCDEARRHILFEVFYSLPAAMTMLAFCCTHVAIYEFVQIAVADCLELNEYYNQTLVYICVFAVAVLLARISGSLYEFTSDDAYSNIKFDMSNKLKLGDLDARTLRQIKKYPTAKLLLDVTALYLTYISANHFMTETLLKTFFDNKEDVLEDLPSMKYPGISTHISNMLLHGEEMFEDPSVVLGEETSAESSPACAVLGGDLCDERVFQACSTLDEFRAKLNVADGEYLYDEVRLGFICEHLYEIVLSRITGIYPDTLLRYPPMSFAILYNYSILYNYHDIRSPSTHTTRSSAIHRLVFITTKAQWPPSLFVPSLARSSLDDAALESGTCNALYLLPSQPCLAHWIPDTNIPFNHICLKKKTNSTHHAYIGKM